MKKIKYLLLSAFLLSFYSCSEDDLNEVPDYAVEVEYGKNPVKDEATMKFALEGVYAQFRNEEAFGSYIHNIGNLISNDVFVSNSNSGYYVTTNRMTWTPSNNEFVHYNKLYDVIQLANNIINSKIEETANVKNYKAQAYIARGLSYFYLAQSFGANPSSGVNQEYGVAMYNGEFDPYAMYPRSTVAQNYEQIISDLKAGIISTNETVSSKGYLSATAARLLLAKAYLTIGDYPNAKLYAEETLSKAPATFGLLTNVDISNYFYGNSALVNQNQKETIWEVNMSEIANVGVNRSMGVLYDPLSARRSILVRAGLVSQYGDTDVRKQWFQLDTRTVDSPTPGYFVKKWRQTIDGKVNTNNIKVLRMTDALFVKWEAMAKSGENAAALQAVNDFAISRLGTPYAGDALTAVLTEKRKEFVAEGQGFFDLKRNNLPIAKGTNCSTCNVSANDKLFVFPIPAGTLNVNTSMKQYPGWNN